MDLPAVTALERASATRWQPGDAFLAGGSWLFSEPQPDVHRLLDLQSYDWPALTRTEAGLEIAATCTLARLNEWDGPGSKLIRQCCGALLGSFKIWQVATVGGNLCLALPAGPMTSLAAALDGSCLLWSPDGTERRVPAAEFVIGDRRTVLRPGELLRSVLLPAATLAERYAFGQLSLSHLGRSAVLVIARVSTDGAAVFTITAATVRPYQLRFAAVPSSDELLTALAAAAPAWHDDVHGAPAWRAAQTRRLLVELRDELA